MSYPSRPFASHLRAPSMGASQSTSGQSTALTARIHEKKAELENLRQLRDLSAGLAAQMEQLEEKLSTLSGGTEAVAAVLANWHNVLRAINMASMKLPQPKDTEEGPPPSSANTETPLPQTLVRIPAEESAVSES